MDKFDICTSKDCCVECCTNLSRYYTRDKLSTLSCQATCNRFEVCSYSEAAIQEGCLISQKFSLGGEYVLADEILQCQSSGIILARKLASSQDQEVVSSEAVKTPFLSLAVPIGAISFLIIIVLSLCSKKARESSVPPPTTKTEPVLRVKTSVTNTTLPRKKESTGLLIPVKTSSERLSTKSKGSTRSEKKKRSSRVEIVDEESRGKMDVNESFEYSRENVMRVDSVGSKDLSQSPLTPELSKSKKRKKKKFQAPKVGFKIDSAYSVAKDSSIASAMSKDSAGDHNSSSLPRSVGGQKRAAFSSQEVIHIYNRSASLERSKSIKKYDDIDMDASINDMRTSVKSGEDRGNDSSFEKEKQQQIPSIHRRQVRNARARGSVVNVEDVFGQDSSNMKLEDDDEDLKMIHNNRETTLDI